MMYTTGLLLAVLSASTGLCAIYEITAWSGAACSGIEVGFVTGDDTNPVLGAAESTPNGQCVTIDRALGANCDLYLCADAQCNDQGTTVEGPLDALTRVANQSFEGMQVGCQ